MPEKWPVDKHDKLSLTLPNQRKKPYCYIKLKITTLVPSYYDKVWQAFSQSKLTIYNDYRL